MFRRVKNKKSSIVSLGGDLIHGSDAHVGIAMNEIENYAILRATHRLRLGFILFSLLFFVLLFRLVSVCFDDTKDYYQFVSSDVSEVMRPRIFDRHHVLMATDISTFSLSANPQKIDDVESVVNFLSHDMSLGSQKRIHHLLLSNRSYVELGSDLTSLQYEAVLKLGNPYLNLKKHKTRVYPQGRLASHLLGFVGRDQRGLAGIERVIDRVQDPLSFVQTVIDLRVQHSVRVELYDSIRRYSAKGGCAIIVDVDNGDIISMVSLPDFDPNHSYVENSNIYFNQASFGIYEFGSIFKIFTAAMALDSGNVSLLDTFDTRESLKIGNYEIDDLHGQKRPLTVEEIVTYSSNIGAAQLALSVTPDENYTFFSRLGLLDRPVFKLPETARPIFPVRWGEIERMTMSYGHGIAVSPLQAVMAGASMVNGGVLYHPRLFVSDEVIGKQVITPKTSYEVSRMMRMVVTHGTASKAKGSGYQILGKTGSGEKASKNGYDKDRLITSFLGAFPARKPRYAFIVMLDEPLADVTSYGHATAGWNAVPTATKIVNRIAPLLNIIPDSDKNKGGI